jgi:diamine N-acetyltransferase
MANAIPTKKRRKAEPALNRHVGEITVLRAITAGDLPALQAWDADPAIIALMGRKFQETEADAWLRSLDTERNCRAWVIESPEGRLIGELELAQLNWRAGSAELRICIGERDCWGQGYGTDAIRTALRVAFETLGLQSVYLRVFTTNNRAVRVYERLGFHKQALLQPSVRRADPSPVLLMNLTRERWYIRQSAGA